MSFSGDNLIPSEQLRLPDKYAHLTPNEYIQELMNYIEKYRQWTTLHIVDFLTFGQWNILNEEWREALLPPDGSISHEEWIDAIIKITSGSDVNVIIRCGLLNCILMPTVLIRKIGLNH